MATNIRYIEAPPERVFEVFADGWLYASWVVGASRMRGVDDGWPAPGTSLHHSFGVWPAVLNDRTVSLVWEPPRRAVLRARGWPVGEAQVELRVKPRGEGSLVRLDEDAVKGPGRFIPRVLRDVGITARNRETLDRLAFLVEGGAR